MEFAYRMKIPLVAVAMLAPLVIAAGPAMAQKKPNVVMLMADDIGSADLGVAGGGVTLGHPTPQIDQLAREGAYFTGWYVRQAARQAARRSRPAEFRSVQRCL
jgi:arylsulfatase